jgi:aminopeptidase S
MLAACVQRVVPADLPPRSDPASVAPSTPDGEAPTPAPPPTPAATPTPAAPAATPTPLTSVALRELVEVDRIRAHLEALQRIADADGGHRASGSSGFSASVEYVAARLETAGYRVERLPFEYAAGSGTNLVAELVGTEPAAVVIIGAHLDSTPNGPGINDNGSGVATVLTIAEALPSLAAPAATIRFAFWDAEESGRHGSTAYVAGLTAAERTRIDAYLNLDIIASPNFVRFVYDELGAAPGSAAITDLLGTHFAAQGLAWGPIDLAGKTDHAAFSKAGIPTGGLFSGGTEPKTAAQAAAYGGTAGVPADPCIHRACDVIGSINDLVLAEMAEAAAHVLARLAAGPGSG